MKNIDLLENWVVLNKNIKKLKENDLLVLLEREKAGANRSGFLTRIHGRYNVLRAKRERREIFGGK